MRLLRRAVLALAIIAALCVSFNFAHVNGEIVRNSGFETWTSSTQPLGWIREVAGTSTITQDGADVHGGSYSAKYTIDASNSAAQLYAKIRVVASQNYALSFWYKTAASKTIYLKIRDIGSNVWLKNDGTWPTSNTAISLPAATVWTQYTLNFTSHATYTVLYFFISRNSAASSSVYVDDASIQGPLPPADIYYVDTTGGNDANDGLSTGTAWKTVTPVNNWLSVAGDSFLFKCGETFPGQILSTASGAAGNVVTYGSYDTGAKPIIDGAGHNYGIGITHDYITADGLDVRNGAVAGIYISSAAHDAINACDMTDNKAGIYAVLATNLAISGTTSDGNTDDGINLLGVTGVTISNTTGSENGISGLNVTLSGSTPSTSITATDCTFSTNGLNGISLTGNIAGSTGFTGTRVTCSENLNDGFNVHYAWANVIFDHCVANTNGDDGIGADGDGYTFHETSSGIIRYSVAHNNKKSAIAHINSSSVSMYYNLFSHDTNGTIGLITLSDTGTHYLYNNVIVSQAQTGYGVHISCTATVRNNIIVGFDSGFWNDSGTITEDHNDVYGAGTANFVTHEPGAHTKQVDPIFYSSTDFRLRSNSPCRMAGVSVGLTTDFAGNKVPKWATKAPDMGAYEMWITGAVVR